MSITHKKNRTEHSISYTVFVVSVIIAIVTITSMQISQIKSKKEHVSYIAEAAGYTMDSAFSKYLTVAQFWDNYIVNNKGLVNDFQIIAKSLYQGDITLNTIELAPGGTISYIYPRPSSLDISKLSLLSTANKNVDLVYSKNTGTTVITGPSITPEGVKIITIHKPIYVKDNNDIEQFWGFSNISVKLTTLLSSIHLERLNAEGYEYKLRKLNSENGEYTILQESSQKELTKPLIYELKIPDGNINLLVQPVNGWVDLNSLMVQIFISLIICALGAQCAWLLFTLTQKESKMEQLSYVDHLTKLANAAKFTNDLKLFQSTNKPYAIMYIGLNDFKPINDTYGHKTGNEVLAITAKKIRNSVRENDSVFRIEGDEFAIFIPNELPISGLDGLSSRLYNTIGRETHVGEYLIKTKASIGYARYPYDGTNYEEIIIKAETAMYQDKKNQKNTSI